MTVSEPSISEPSGTPAVARLRARLATTGRLEPVDQAQRRTAARRAGAKAAADLPLAVLALLADPPALDELAAISAALLHANDMAMCITGADRKLLDASIPSHVSAIALSHRAKASPPQGLDAQAIATQFKGDAAALKALWLQSRTGGLVDVPALPDLGDATRQRFETALTAAEQLLEAAQQTLAEDAA